MANETLERDLQGRIDFLLGRAESSLTEGLEKRSKLPSGTEPGLWHHNGRQGIHLRDGGSTEIFAGQARALFDARFGMAAIFSPLTVLAGQRVSLTAQRLGNLSVQGKSFDEYWFGPAQERGMGLLMPKVPAPLRAALEGALRAQQASALTEEAEARERAIQSTWGDLEVMVRPKITAGGQPVANPALPKAEWVKLSSLFGFRALYRPTRADTREAAQMVAMLTYLQSQLQS